MFQKWFYVGVLVLFASAITPGLADENLRALRDDPSVPAHCTDVRKASFRSLEQIVYFGIDGSLAKGFSHEVDLDRGDASRLWGYLKAEHGKPSVKKELQPLYETLLNAADRFGFTYKAEGEVLEALAILKLLELYPESDYYVTGGISYLNNASRGRYETLGELDLVVARRSDCAVVVVGEAKLGISQLAHAREQITRFRDWIRRQVCTSREARADAPLCFQ